jgi:hypothetical protein
VGADIMLVAIIVGLAAGAVVGALSSFFQLIGQAFLYERVRSFLTDLPLNPTSNEMLRFNLSAYAIWCSAILIVLLIVRKLTPGLLFYCAFFGAFFIAFPIPAIWLIHAWQSYG